MSTVDHTALIDRARPRLGLLTAADIVDLGLSRRQADGLRSAGVLRRVGAGVDALAAAPSTPRQRLLAATLLAGDGAVASHLAAAWVWGFDGIQADGIELSVPRARNPRVRGPRIHRVTDLLPVDATACGPQPITTPARTLLDIALRVSPEELEEAFDGARRRGQIHLAFLEWRLAELRRRGRPGVVALERLLRREHTSARAESWLESAFLRILRDAFLPPPRVQVVKLVGPGRRVRLDALYDDARLVVEVGGHAWHSARRQRQSDAERRARLVARGLRVVDFTYEDVTERPSHIADTVAELLGFGRSASTP